MKAVLGIDTSCYTTSAALVATSGRIIASSRRLLTVEAGERGLMQSEGLFQHVKNLPDMISDVMGKAPDIVAVSASTRPRPAQESYMPVFRAGESQARAAAALLRVPFYPVSHQEGHVRAAMVDSGIDPAQPFLALHLSGGTTEILLCEAGRLTLLGGSLDLHAGQLVDRTGVRMNLPFPAGPSLEKLAMEGRDTTQGLIGVAIRGVDCCMAGAENKVMRFLSEGAMSREQIAAEVFDFLARTIERQIEAACERSGCRQALLAGGVASSLLLREMLCARAKKRRLSCRLCFARPELSGDNAVGVALLGADLFRQNKEESTHDGNAD